ncbi:MAG: hypothetical protein IPK85_25900 [Gemmatimonadetes bacterium]|nr:hypothetical protein [Gemmatimonadota bacterium]
MLPVDIERALGALASQIPDLRRAQSGGASLEVALGRVERPEMASANVIEGGALRAIAVPNPAGPTVRAFLDGIQESREVAWIGTVPVVLGRVAAVVREREGSSLRTWDAPSRREALYAPWARLPRRVRALVEEFGPEAREVSTDDGGHPLRAMQDATNAVKQDREALERALAERYCASARGPLYVDGPLPPADAVVGSDQVVGVIKSHQTMYVSGRPWKRSCPWARASAPRRSRSRAVTGRRLRAGTCASGRRPGTGPSGGSCASRCPAGRLRRAAPPWPTSVLSGSWRSARHSRSRMAAGTRWRMG